VLVSSKGAKSRVVVEIALLSGNGSSIMTASLWWRRGEKRLFLIANHQSEVFKGFSLLASTGKLRTAGGAFNRYQALSFLRVARTRAIKVKNERLVLWCAARLDMWFFAPIQSGRAFCSTAWVRLLTLWGRKEKKVFSGNGRRRGGSTQLIKIWMRT